MSIATKILNCRSCGNNLGEPFLNLGNSPLANSYETANERAKEFPLAVCFCSKCYLVQLDHNIDPESMFSDYAYFSSFSDTFLTHAENTVIDLVKRFSINSDSSVLEIASNDGYLLQYMKQFTPNILGVDPAKNIAAEANSKGIRTLDVFFNYSNAIKLVQDDGQNFNLIIGNNVLAHVPDINDFIKGVEYCLTYDGVATFEFPYIMPLLRHVEFDTIYHEHVFYYSVIALKNLFNKHGLEIFDVRYTQIHGGSIRIFIQHKNKTNYSIDSSVSTFEFMERMEGLDDSASYVAFTSKVDNVRRELWHLINSQVISNGLSLAAYGAPAKGNTLLNYCNIDSRVINFTVDVSPHKQGKFLPGSHIPIYAPEELIKRMPDYCLLLPWNFKEEIITQQAEYLRRGGKFIIPIPEPYEVSR